MRKTIPKWLVAIDQEIAVSNYSKTAQLLYDFLRNKLSNLTKPEEKVLFDYMNQLSLKILHKLFNVKAFEHRSLIQEIFSLFPSNRKHNPIISLLKTALSKNDVLKNEDHVCFICYLAIQGELTLLEKLAEKKEIHFDMNDYMGGYYIRLLVQDLKEKIKNLSEKDPVRADLLKIWSLMRKHASYQTSLKSNWLAPRSSEHDLCSRTRQLFADYKSFNLNDFMFALKEDMQKKKIQYEAAKAIPVIGEIKAKATRYEIKRNFILQKVLPAIQKCIGDSSDVNKEKLARILREGAYEFTTFNRPSKLALIFEQAYFELTDPVETQVANFVLNFESKPVVGVVEKAPTKKTDCTNCYRIFTPYVATTSEVDADFIAALESLHVPTTEIPTGEVLTIIDKERPCAA